MTSTEPEKRSVLSGPFGPVLIMLAIMWLVRLVDTVTPGSLNQFGIRSWDWSTIWSLLTAPFLHTGWLHLVSNTIPFLILGGIVARRGKFLQATVLIALIGGLGVFFLNSPGQLTVGASGLVFGYFGYILIDGLFERQVGAKIKKLAVAFVVAGFWGIPMLLGVLPIRVGVSWQGHLFGLIGGLVAAFILSRKPEPTTGTSESTRPW